MHRPLTRSRVGRVKSRLRRTSVGIIPTTIPHASASDREFSFLNRLLLLSPLAAHKSTWMEDRHDDGGENHHSTLEDHEWDFFVCEFALETVGELGYTEAGADENEEEGEGECWGFG